MAPDTREIPVEYLLSLTNNSMIQTTCIKTNNAVIKIRPILFFTAPFCSSLNLSLLSYKNSTLPSSM